MAWSQSDLDALDAALKSGMKRVRYKDHDAEYQDTQQMLQLRAVMKAEIESAGKNGSVILAGRLPC